MNTSDDLQLKRYLHGLPLAEPPDQLGARILARHTQRRWLRRWVAPLAIAASLTLAALLPIALQQPLAPEVPVSSVSVDPLVLAEIRALDRRLQSSYLVAGDSSQREALWQARQQTEARLKSGAPAPQLVQL